MGLSRQDPNQRGGTDGQLHGDLTLSFFLVTSHTAPPPCLLVLSCRQQHLRWWLGTSGELPPPPPRPHLSHVDVRYTHSLLSVYFSLGNLPLLRGSQKLEESYFSPPGLLPTQ